MMYLMVDKWADVYFNVNMVYMTGAMVAIMAIIELVLMASMYKGDAIRYSAIGAALLVLILSIAFTRYQTGIGNKSFLTSMIPHHSGAILMCTKRI